MCCFKRSQLQLLTGLQGEESAAEMLAGCKGGGSVGRQVCQLLP